MSVFKVSQQALGFVVSKFEYYECKSIWKKRSGASYTPPEYIERAKAAHGAIDLEAVRDRKTNNYGRLLFW